MNFLVCILIQKWMLHWCLHLVTMTTKKSHRHRYRLCQKKTVVLGENWKGFYLFWLFFGADPFHHPQENSVDWPTYEEWLPKKSCVDPQQPPTEGRPVLRLEGILPKKVIKYPFKINKIIFFGFGENFFCEVALLRMLSKWFFSKVHMPSFFF